MRPRTLREWRAALEASGWRAARKTAREWCGPCPLCGGRDRFHVGPGRRVAVVAGCRVCGADFGTLARAVFGDPERRNGADWRGGRWIDPETSGARRARNAAGRPRTARRPFGRGNAPGGRETAPRAEYGRSGGIPGAIAAGGGPGNAESGRIRRARDLWRDRAASPSTPDTRPGCGRRGGASGGRAYPSPRPSGGSPAPPGAAAWLRRFAPPADWRAAGAAVPDPDRRPARPRGRLRRAPHRSRRARQAVARLDVRRGVLGRRASGDAPASMGA